MDIKPQVEFDQGFFKFTTPYTWQGWAWWILIILIMVGSLFFQPQGYIISLVMFVVLAMLSPTGLEAKLHRMRKQNPLPEDLEAQALNKLDLEEEVPEDLYDAVAEVLNFVYELKSEGKI